MRNLLAVRHCSLLLAASAALMSVLTPALLTVSAHADATPAAALIDRITGSEPLPNGVRLRSDRAVIEVTALRDDVIRVRVGRHGTLPEDASWAVLPSSRREQQNHP